MLSNAKLSQRESLYWQRRFIQANQDKEELLNAIAYALITQDQSKACRHLAEVYEAVHKREEGGE